MTGFHDEEVRSAALAKIQQLRERYGGRIPRSELMAGVTIRGQRIPVWNYQKGIFKPAVLGRDGSALSVQTSIESPYEDDLAVEAGHISYMYRGNDPFHADNVALRRAGNQHLPLSYLVAVDPGYYDAIAPVYVIEDHPDRHRFTLVADSTTVPAIGEDSLINEVRREYVTRTVLQRLHQQQFRRMVLRAYRNQCSICRLRHVQLLDAAHILPDRHSRGTAAVPNGLGLCKIHHSAYDANIIGIDPGSQVHVRVDILREKDGPMLQHGIQGIEGARLVLPKQLESRPNQDYLAERFEQFRAA